MSVEVSYKANEFLSNLQSLKEHFEFITKQYAMKYIDSKTFFELDNGLVFYPKFYIERIKALKDDLDTFFQKNEQALATLSDFYQLKIQFDDNLQFSNFFLYVEDLTEEMELAKGLKKLQKKSFYKDKNLINYLISLKEAIEEKDKLGWEEWLERFSFIPMTKNSKTASYNDFCFGNNGIDFILETEISEIDKMAMKLKKTLINDFEGFISSNPVTYIDNQLSIEAQKQLKELQKINNTKGIRLPDKLRMLADKVDGSKESINIILENLTLESFLGLLKELLNCIPGILTFEELSALILEGSFESLKEDFLQEILELLPPEMSGDLEVITEVRFPWNQGANELSFKWFEILLKEIDVVFANFKIPSLFDICTVIDTFDFPSAMYELIKLHFGDQMPDIDFKAKIPELGQTIEEYLVLKRQPLPFMNPIKLGDSDQYVLLIQQFLNKNGITDNKNKRLKEDSKFGNKTKEAVKKYQKNNKDINGQDLEATGVVNEPTFKSMFPIPKPQSLYSLTADKFELLLIELVELKNTLEEFGITGIIPEFTIPSFSNFTLKKVCFPNFKKREITFEDYKQFLVFLKIHFPGFEIGEINFGTNTDGEILTDANKKNFFKLIYETVFQVIVFDLKLQLIFEDVFFNKNKKSSIYLTKELNLYFKKLFDSIVIKLLPSISKQYSQFFVLEFSQLDLTQIIFEKSLEIPQIKILFDSLLPEIDGLSSIDFGSLGNLTPKFKFNTDIRLPAIPKIPSIKFNLMEFLADKFYQVILKVIIKLFLTLLARVLDKITLEVCTDPQQGGLENKNPDGGLGTVVGSVLCPDKDQKSEALNLLEKSINAMTTSKTPNKNIEKVLEIFSVCATVDEMIPAMLGESDKLSPNFLGKMSDIINSAAPELSDILGKPEQIAELLEQAGNQLNEEQREALEGILIDTPQIDAPVSATICLSKQALEEWKENRERLFTDAGFDPKVAKELVDKQRERAAKEVKEIVEIATKIPEGLFSDAINSILNPEGSADTEDCENPLNPKEIVEKINEISDDLLDKTNTTFIDDLLVPEQFGDYKGVLSKILADKYDRTFSEISTIKENFFLNMLVSFGMIPAPEFPETVFKDLTDKLNDISFNYTEEEQFTNSIVDKPIFSLPILSSVKQTVYSYKHKKADINLQYKNNSSVEYLDYIVGNENNNAIKFQNAMIVPRKSTQNKLVQDFSNFGFNSRTKPKDILISLMGEENSGQISVLNSKLINYMKSLFSSDIVYGYPTEIKQEDISYSGGNNENKILATLDNPSQEGRVQILDPEIYGGTYEKPKIFIKPPNESNATGYYLYSKKLFSDNSANKLDSTILKLSSVSAEINKSKNIVDQERYKKSLGIKDANDILEKPYISMIQKDKMANLWGHFNILIRTYLAQFFTMSYPVVKKLGMKHENYGDLLFSFIENKLKTEMNQIKKIDNPKDTYNPFIIYCLVLESLVNEYISKNENEITKYFYQKIEEYEPLFEEDLRFLKSQKHNSIVLGLTPKYQNFVRGFSALSFGDNWQGVLNSTAGFSIICFNLEDTDLRLASKIGFILSDMDMIRDIIKEKVIEQASNYEKLFEPEISNIYLDFMTSPDGLNVELNNLSYNSQSDSYNVKKFIKVIDKSGQSTTTDFDGLKEMVKDFSLSDYVSDVFGNAEIESIYEMKYKGTIGIKFGVSFDFNDTIISSFERDVQDVTIKELLEMDENLNEDVECCVEELLKTQECELFFKHCLKVEKIGSLAAIYFMENGIHSIGEGTDEREFEIPNPFGGFVDLLLSSSPEILFLTTKKEILKNMLSFIHREERDAKIEKTNFTDYKKKQTIDSNFDFKNLLIKGEGSIPFFTRKLITNNIELDEEGNPIVNKFLSSHFSEE